MNVIFFLIFGLLFSLGFGIGFFFIKKPEVAIELQRRFYAKINWKIEPISMPKEVRNTRIMGLAVIILLLATVLIYFIKSPAF